MNETATPDTLSYLILGLIVVTIIMGTFLVSLVVRYRNAQKDVELLQQLNEE